MTSKAFDKIAEGLNEALAIARGTAAPARLHVPAEMDVRAIRVKTGMAQEQFASAFGFTVHQVQSVGTGATQAAWCDAGLPDGDRQENHEGVLAMLRDASETQRAA